MATERINDIGFRLILIPLFGIAIPLATRMIDPHSFSHWMLKLAFAYTIGIAFVIWQGNRYLLLTLRSYFDWFNQPARKIIVLVAAVSFFTIPVCIVTFTGWYQLFAAGRVNWGVIRVSTTVILVCVIFITHVYETAFLVKDYHDLAEDKKGEAAAGDGVAGAMAKEKFLVRRGKEFVAIRAEEIAFFRASQKLVCLVKKDGGKFMLDYSLAEIEKQVDRAIWFRLNRKYLVNAAAIRKVSALPKSRLSVDVEPAEKEELVVSSENSAAFKRWFGS